jgi:hypothetical protein
LKSDNINNEKNEKEIIFSEQIYAVCDPCLLDSIVKGGTNYWFHKTGVKHECTACGGMNRRCDLYKIVLKNDYV